MKSYNELKKQLNGLVLGIKECNFIPWHIKQDILGDTWVKIVEKMNDDTLKDDYNEIKGYTFQILRNYCLAYHRDKEKKGTLELKWDVPEDLNTDKEEYHKELKSIVEKKIQSIKYNNLQKKLIMLALSNVERDQAEIELGLTKDQYKRMRQGIVLQLKGDMRRKVKYLIKHKDKDWVQIPCYTSSDVKRFLTNHTARQVSSIIYDGLMSTDGFYVEILHKIERKKKTT